MRILLTGVVATMIIVAVGVVGWRAEAATMQANVALPFQTESHNLVEEVGYWRRQSRRAYRRGYSGYGYPYYGYAYRPYYGYGYRPYGYYGYGYRPYGYYRRWRY